MKIALIGKVSSGKTSFLNAIIGKLIGKVSLLRETTECTRYSYNEHTILDFPGLNDSDDEHNDFMTLFRERVGECQLVFYITDCRKAFITESERVLFNLIEGIVEEQYQMGNYCKLKTIANKYDDYDEEIEQLLAGVSCYKISSHNLLMERLINNDMSIDIPDEFKKEFKKIMTNAGIHCNIKSRINFKGVKLSAFASPGDWDGLLEMIDVFAANIGDNQKIMAYDITHRLVSIDNLDLSRDQLQLLYRMYQMCPENKDEIDEIINTQLIAMNITRTNHRGTQDIPNSCAPQKTLITYYKLTGNTCHHRLDNYTYKLCVALCEHNKEYIYDNIHKANSLLISYTYYNIKRDELLHCDGTNWEWYNYLIKLNNATHLQIQRKIALDDTFLPHIKKEYNKEILFNVMYQRPILTFDEYDTGDL